MGGLILWGIVLAWGDMVPAIDLGAGALGAEVAGQSEAAAHKESSPETKPSSTSRAVSERIASERKRLVGVSAEERRSMFWRIAGAESLLADGRAEEAIRSLEGQLPVGWHGFHSGDLGMMVETTGQGVRLVALWDSAVGRSLSARQPLALFSLRLRHAETKEYVNLWADAGWGQVGVSHPAEDRLVLRWEKPAESRLGEVCVEAEARRTEQAGLAWKLRVDLGKSAWSVWQVAFPQLAVADLGPEAAVLFPRGPGEVQRGLWQRGFQYEGLYPNGWTSMAFLAAYSADGSTGLYLGIHDPAGSTKEVKLQSRPDHHAVVLAFEHPAPQMGQPGNGFQLPGEAVWQLVRGDWYDAAMIYRDWVRKHARWFPKLSAEGREDTPLWMRELPAWALSGGTRTECVPEVKAFREFLGVPIGVHWYNWHQIPFDNDYPHYFPTKEGFAEGVRELQQSGVHVMPYINGRLWDTRDRGTEDFQFTAVARLAATKDEKGEPYTEVYGSKEADGSPVRLAVMCPSTKLWQGKVQEIVSRLFDECGVHGVYIDQVAAAQPRLCFDPAHGHPLGGGAWWTESYWSMLAAIRQQKPPDRMLTTECNGEPFIHCFDGYLTWHWQYDGQVPAFPAVYGGAIQMFGRAYRGGETKDLALRMKAGQQLVFGEQIGWIHPGVIHEKENAEFLRQVIRLRWNVRRYFYAGQMARPPKLVGEIPKLTADWQWSGRWPVTTDALLAGAWILPAEQRLALLFANVGDAPVKVRLDFDAGRYGLSGSTFQWVRHTADGPQEKIEQPAVFQRELEFPVRGACVWECSSIKK